MKISVIIPTYNESEVLTKTLSRIKETSHGSALEIIVVDGGSQDGTPVLAQNLADKVFISKRTGRSIQLHEGALAATGDILLFLHADCLLPDDWQASINTAYSSHNPPVATAFRKKFDNNSPLYQFIALGSALRQWMTRTPHGDQAVSVPKERYFQIGGFPPVELMEEYYLAEKLRRYGKIQSLSDNVVVSTRRYENGPLFHAFRNVVVVLLHYLGVSPAFLKKVYTRNALKTPIAAALLLFISFSHARAFDSSHALFEKTLQQVNDQGLIDYRSLKDQPKDLNDYLLTLAKVSGAEIEKWPRDEKIAFWINAYNAFTLKAIIDHYPIKSIRDIDGVWKHPIYLVAGKKRSLDEIEHEILRKKFNEPRIHMALVCAAMSCPPLGETAFTGLQLEQQLKDQSSAFLSNLNHFRIDKEARKVYLSSIFNWFGDDFIKTYTPKTGFAKKSSQEKAVLNFIAGHSSAGDREFLQSGQYNVDYLDYDWALNEKRS
jgi:rSAM/selenodomain-associated transferase 2